MSTKAGCKEAMYEIFQSLEDRIAEGEISNIIVLYRSDAAGAWGSRMHLHNDTITESIGALELVKHRLNCDMTEMIDTQMNKSSGVEH